MIRNILSVALLSAFVVNADAWTPPNTPASVSASKSGAAGERFIEQNLFYLMAPPTDKEAFVDGAVTFTHAGRNYALKAIFSRAIFDPGMETYRTGLQYQLSDFTDPQNIVIWVPIDPAASPVKDFNNNSDGTDLHIVSGARYVEITAATNGKSQKYKFRRQDLLDNWESNALNYSQELGGYTWHFVPQVVWQPRGWGNYYSRIFVISGEKPFDGATGMPLDAVRLCTGFNNRSGCEIPNYVNSLATGLQINQNTTAEGGGQRVEDISVNMLHVFIKDELDGKCRHYNCEKTGIEFDSW